MLSIFTFFSVQFTNTSFVVKSVVHGERETDANYRKRVQRNETVSEPIGNGSLEGGWDSLDWKSLEKNHWT
jgi:hypothetical protein